MRGGVWMGVGLLAAAVAGAADWPEQVAAVRAQARNGDLRAAGEARTAAAVAAPDLLASLEALVGAPVSAWRGTNDAERVRQAAERLAGEAAEGTAALLRLRLAQLVADDTPGALAAFRWTYERAHTNALRRLPPFACVRRRAYGLRGTNGTLFSHATPRGSALVVCDPAGANATPRVIFENAAGFIWDLSPSWDGTRLLLGCKEQVQDPFHVWEIGVDGAGLRQLTRGPWHDFNPVYGPGGRIVFCSSRVESYSLCQNFLASALYTCAADGSDVRRIDFTTLCTSAPSILPDGRILCTRWEYQDKNIFSWQGLWTINPDGRQLRLFYGNTLTVPNSRYGGKPVPGADEVLLTMAAHHHPPIGDIALLDRSRGLESPAALTKLTAETPYQPARGRDWQDANWSPGDAFFPCAATDPWPLGQGRFLFSVGNASRGEDAGFRLCLGLYSGVRFPVLAEEGNGFFAAVALTPRPEPAMHVEPPPQEPGEGVFYVADVYRGLLEQGVQRGQVKALRVVRQLPKKWNTEGPRFHDHYPIVGYGSYYVKENLGEAPVDESGAACFRAPSNVELYFIALDRDGKEVQRMGSVTQITSGEQVACVGCHESRLSAPPADGKPGMRLARPPDTLRPPPWGAGPFDYVAHVQPVWDRHCVRCHAGRAPAGGVDLSGDKTRFFNMSYDHLVARNMVERYYINRGPTGVFPALRSGSAVSRLTRFIEDRHKDVELDAESRRRVYAWIDSNVQYYPTWDMSRPYTTGGRDPWHFVPENRRVAPQPEPWLAELDRVYTPHCARCHGDLDANGNRPHNWWINLTRPAHSRLLNAHLAREAGGLGRTGERGGVRAPVFGDTADPVYKALLQALEQGRDALLARPRMDMPGAVAVPQERDFGRVF